MSRLCISGSCAGPLGHTSLCPSVRDRILASFVCPTASTSGRQCAIPTVAPPSGRRQQQAPVVCRATAQRAGKGKGKSAKDSDKGKDFKGFGAPPKESSKPAQTLAFDEEEDEEELAAADDEEAVDMELKPSYRMYTNSGFKAPRLVGPIELRRPEGSPLPVLVTSANTLPGDLMAVLPPLGFASGGFQEVPELEDLHAAMIEDGLKPAQRRVLTLLESLRPPPAAPETPTASPASIPSTPATPLPSLATLDPKFWSNRGKDTQAPEFSSKRLMSLLGRTAISSDAQDPAASQTRHEKPLGYVGLWPEAALLAHSCVPNTSQVVVGDRLFMHSVGELPRGTALTRNQIGEVVTAPLAMRQEAVAELMAELGVTEEQLRAQMAAGAAAEGAVGQAGEALLTACRCPRCRLEASVSESLRDTLDSAYSWFNDDAREAWNRANQTEDEALLKGLLSECEVMLTEVEEAIQAEKQPQQLASSSSSSSSGEEGELLDEEQRDWLRASVYDVYDMYVMLDELVRQDEADPDLLQACLTQIAVFSPGSDNHMMVALKNYSMRQHRAETFSAMLQRERASGSGLRKAGAKKSDAKKLAALTAAVDGAYNQLLESIIMRYGWLNEETMTALAEGMQTFVDGLEQMSAMKAQGMTELTHEMEVDGVKVQIVDRLEVSEESRGGHAVGVAAGSGAQAGGRGAVEVVNQDGLSLSVVGSGGGQQGAEEEEGELGEGEWVEVGEGGLGDAGLDIDLAALEADLAEQLAAEVDAQGGKGAGPQAGAAR